MFVQHAAASALAAAHADAANGEHGDAAAVGSQDWVGLGSNANGFAPDETVVNLSMSFDGTDAAADDRTAPGSARGFGTAGRLGSTPPAGAGTPGADLKHLRYGTTRAKHRSLNFSEFCAVMRLVALRRYGRTDLLASDGDAVAAAHNDKESMKCMLVTNLLPLAERMGDELLRRGTGNRMPALLDKQDRLLADSSLQNVRSVNKASLRAVFDHYATMAKPMSSPTRGGASSRSSSVPPGQRHSHRHPGAGAGAGAGAGVGAGAVGGSSAPSTPQRGRRDDPDSGPGTTVSRSSSVSPRSRERSSSRHRRAAHASRTRHLMSLTQLYQFSQDFGVLPDVCDMVTLQDAFAAVKSRLRGGNDDFVDLLSEGEFEEVLCRVALVAFEGQYDQPSHRLCALFRHIEESGGRRKLARSTRGPPTIRRFTISVPGVAALPLQQRTALPGGHAVPPGARVAASSRVFQF